MRTSRRKNDKTSKGASGAQRPADVWAALAAILDENADSLREKNPWDVYGAVESVLLSPSLVKLWCEYIRALHECAPPAAKPRGANVPRHVLDSIEAMGLCPAAGVDVVTPEQAQALLRNTDLLCDLHVRVYTSDSAYWRKRRSRLPEEEPIACEERPEPPMEQEPEFSIRGKLNEGSEYLKGVIEPIPSWAKVAAVIAIAVLCAGAGYLVDRALVGEKLEWAANKWAKAEQAQTEWEAAFAALEFEKVTKVTVQIQRNEVVVKLSPRIDEGLVRDVDVCWGDSGDQWERIYEKDGRRKRFRAAHTYALPPPDDTRTWTLRVMFKVPDDVERAADLKPNRLTAVWRLKASAGGIRATPVATGEGPITELAAAEHPEIKWLKPAPESETGWLTAVELLSETDTQRVTLLVQPEGGTAFYVQGGAGPLTANKPRVFEIGLGHAVSQDIRDTFEILVVHDDHFLPARPDLRSDEGEVPQSSIISRLTVRKAAGRIEVVPPEDPATEQIRAQGEIWTPYGGALLQRTADGYRVLKVISPSPTGGPFDVELRPEEGEPCEIYLLVRPEGAPEPEVNETLLRIDPDSYWLYEPAPISSDDSAQSSNTGDEQ